MFLNKEEYKKQLKLYTERKNILKFNIYTKKTVNMEEILNGIYVNDLRLKLEYYFEEFTRNRDS